MERIKSSDLHRLHAFNKHSEKACDTFTDRHSESSILKKSPPEAGFFLGQSFQCPNQLVEFHGTREDIWGNPTTMNAIAINGHRVDFKFIQKALS